MEHRKTNAFKTVIMSVALVIAALPVSAQDVGNTTGDASLHKATLTLATVPVGSFDDFFKALRHKESRGNYSAVNTLNFLGAYQFGEAALIDLGYVRRDRNIYDNNFSGGFTGKHGIRSIQGFLNNPRVQDKAAQDWMRMMWKYIRAEGLHRYAWKEVGGSILTPSGMLAATHLLGTGALKKYVRSQGSASIKDPYGMPLSTYINDLAGYEVPFAPKPPRGQNS